MSNAQEWRHDPEQGDALSQIIKAPLSVKRNAAQHLSKDGHSDRRIRKTLKMSGRQFKKAKREGRLSIASE